MDGGVWSYYEDAKKIITNGYGTSLGVRPVIIISI